MSTYNDVLEILSTEDRDSRIGRMLSEALSNASLPNIPAPTMGGLLFWNTIAERNGWKLQQNMLTQHARILDSSNVRIAWGGIKAMMKTMKRMASMLEDERAEAKSATSAPRDVMGRLEHLKELREKGLIDEEEYRDKKAELLESI